MRRLVTVVAVLTGLAGSAANAAAPAELEPLAFLIGEWSASDSRQSGAGSGTAVFTRGLQDRVILRTSYAEYATAPGKPPSRHDDLLIIYALAGKGARADYYDSEGHVIRYTVRSPATGQAVFLSEGTEGEPRFRLSYRLEATGVLKGEFAIAPPGAAEAFKPYLTWESRQATGATK